MNVSKKKAKKPIWEKESEADTKEGRERFQKRIDYNSSIVELLQKKKEESEALTEIKVPLMKDFFWMAELHKRDHGDTLELFKWVFENQLALHNQLAETLQYLEDNIQTLGEKTSTELRTMKDKMAVNYQNTLTVYNMIKNQGEPQISGDKQKLEKTVGVPPHVV